MGAATMDLFAGLKAKHQGMDLATAKRRELLRKVRIYLEVLASSRDERTATADDIDIYLDSLGLARADLGNAAGATFPGNKWEYAGTTRSERPARHGGRIVIWRLR